MGCETSKQRTLARVRLTEFQHVSAVPRNRQRRRSTVTVEVQDREEAAYKRRSEALRRVSIKVSEDEIERIKRAKLNVGETKHLLNDQKPVKRVQIQEPIKRVQAPKRASPPQERHRLLVSGPIIIEEEFINDDRLNPVRDHWNRSPSPGPGNRLLHQPDKKSERCDSGFHDEEVNKIQSPFTPHVTETDSDTRDLQRSTETILDDDDEDDRKTVTWRESGKRTRRDKVVNIRN